MLSSSSKEPVTKSIIIKNCSLGYSNVVKGGSRLYSFQSKPLMVLDSTNSVIPAGESAMRGSESRSRKGDSGGFTLQLKDLWAMEILYLFFLGFLFVTAISAYELFILDTGDPFSIGYSVAKVALVLLVQTLTWLGLFVLVQRILLQPDGIVTLPGLYPVYLTFAYSIIYVTSLFHFCYGTELTSLYFRALGAKVEGRLLFFGHGVYDFPLLTFADGAVLDRCTSSGHFIVFNKMTIGPSRIEGILHEGTLVIANTDMSGSKEAGPNKFYVTPESLRRSKIFRKQATSDMDS